MISRLLSPGIVAIGLVVANSAAAGLIPIRVTEHTRAQAAVTSMQEVRTMGVVLQGFDHSCGSSALATLINSIDQRNLNEEDILDILLIGRSREELNYIETHGYSLLDLKRASEALGYKVVLAKLSWEALRKIDTPVLIHFKPDGQSHFAVVRKIQANRAYLADPSRGNIRLQKWELEAQWHGVALIVSDKQGGQEHAPR